MATTTTKKKKGVKLVTDDVDVTQIEGTTSQKQLAANTEIAGYRPVVSIEQEPQQINWSDEDLDELASIKKKKAARKQKKQQANATIAASANVEQAVDAVVEQEVKKKQAIGVHVTEEVREQIRQQVAQQTAIQQITPDDYEIVKEVIEEENNVDMEGVNIPKLAAGIGDAIENIPDASEDIADYEIKPIKTKKTKEGYFKTKVNIKKSGIPEIINQISTQIRKDTIGLISPRVCDLRVIGNTNKTQLRNSTLKLSVNTVVYKPDHTKLRVNKGTRIMISIPDGFESTGNLLVYLQESRAKTIIEINTKELPDPVTFFSTVISQFYKDGYNVTLKRLQLRGVGNEIMEVVNLILANGTYKAKVFSSPEDNSITSVEIYSKETENNQFIGVRISEGSIQGKFNVEVFDKVYQNTWQIGKQDMSVTYLSGNILNILKKVFIDTDWEEKIAEQEKASLKDAAWVAEDVTEESVVRDVKLNIMAKKITHRKLSLAFYELLRLREEESVPVEITGTLSKQDIKRLAKDRSENYECESIFGTTDQVDFVLSYLAVRREAGDKRAGRAYITREEYYEKYNVRDRRDYDEREKTIIKRQDAERNYHARIYMFQLEYKLHNDSKKYIYRAEKFDTVLKETQFLSEQPILIDKK